MAIPCFMFGCSTAEIDSFKRILINAKHPDQQYLSLHAYREWAKRFAAGLRLAGLKEGDRVMLFSGNGIFNPIVVVRIFVPKSCTILARVIRSVHVFTGTAI